MMFHGYIHFTILVLTHSTSRCSTSKWSFHFVFTEDWSLAMSLDYLTQLAPAESRPWVTYAVNDTKLTPR
jgi:hypothetical protein